MLTRSAPRALPLLVAALVGGGVASSGCSDAVLPSPAAATPATGADAGEPATGKGDGDGDGGVTASPISALRDLALSRMKAAATFFHDHVAREGGYAWHQRLADLGERWGDVRLDDHQFMIQGPGTPEVATAFVEAALADPTDSSYETYATEATMAVLRGQIQSGGWRLYADTKAQPTLRGCYVRGTADCKCAGCTSSTYDDKISQHALVAVMRTDALLGYANSEISAASAYARERIESSQFPDLGGFPQVWTGPVAARPALHASYPPSTGTACGLPACHANSYSTKYWDDPTLNDDLALATVEMLVWAKELYPARATIYQTMIERYGAFLLLAQMPQPQPAWAQQYDAQMQPRWARSWEAPAIAGQESQDVMWALLRLYQLNPTIAEYRDAVGTALAYLEPLDFDDDTKIHRYIALDDTAPENIGFYTVKAGGYPARFSLDSPTYQNYAWEPASYLPAIRAEFERLATDTTPMKPTCAALHAAATTAIAAMVDGDKWVTTYAPNGPRSGSTPGDYLDTATFVTNMHTLAELIVRSRTDCSSFTP